MSITKTLTGGEKLMTDSHKKKNTHIKNKDQWKDE